MEVFVPAKDKKVKTDGEVVQVDWPIHPRSKVSIKDTVLGLLELVRKQFKNDEIYLFHTSFVDLPELDGLTISHHDQSTTLGYMNFSLPIRPKGYVRILFVIPKAPPTD